MGPEPFGTGDLRGGFVGDALGAELEEPGVGVVNERYVQPVDPSHWPVGVVVVAVDVPARGEQEVTAGHPHRVTVHHRPHALAFDHEAEGVL
jgi:hypothetical protein